MKRYKTKLQRQKITSPSQLELLHILNIRDDHFQKRQLLQNLEKGKQGENYVVEIIKNIGPDHWIVIQNIWLNINGDFECDIILITLNSVYVFEIKNYTGLFQYKNGECILNNETLSNNCVAQSQRSFINVKKMVHYVNPSIAVHGALVFAGKQNTVEIKSEIPNIDVVTTKNIENYFYQIEQNEFHHSNSVNTQKVITNFERMEINNPYSPKPLSRQEILNLRKGIYCKECLSFDVEITRSFVKCNCGNVEPREQAMLRTINEFQMLQHNPKICRSDIENFINYQGSSKYVISI